MLLLVTYDVSVMAATGRRRLRNITKTCLDHGVRVQNSVFECENGPAQFTMLKNCLLEIYDSEEDSLGFYFLEKRGRQRVEHHGTKAVADPLKDALVL